MSDWQSPKVEKPPQGLKILWFKGGDCFVAQRLGDKYLSLQPGEAVILQEPMLWSYIEFPTPYEGRMGISLRKGDKPVTFDEFEKANPEAYAELIALVEAHKWKTDPIEFDEKK